MRPKSFRCNLSSQKREHLQQALTSICHSLPAVPAEIRPAGKPGDMRRPSVLTHLKMNTDEGGEGRKVTEWGVKGGVDVACSHRARGWRDRDGQTHLVRWRLRKRLTRKVEEKCVNGCECVWVCVFLQNIEYRNLHSTTKVRTFSRLEDILAGPQNFQGLFESSEMDI